MLHDGHQLLVAVDARDDEPGRLLATFAQRDRLGGDDRVTLLLDPGASGRRAYALTVNARGAVADAITSSVGEGSPNWNGDWQGAGKLTASGYSVEFAIPFAEIGLSPAADLTAVLAINVERSVARGRRETTSWAAVDSRDACRECQFRRVRLAQLDAATRTWRFQPYVAASESRQYDLDSGRQVDRSRSLDVGLDIRWSPRPSDRILATINPDFSQVEVDAIQFDINRRFAITYPERRPFFTEDPGLFATPAFVFYSRTIAEPDAGMQYLHRGNGMTVAALAADDDATTFILPSLERSGIVSLDRRSTNAIARVVWSPSQQLSTGLVATSRRAGDYDNDVLGVDARWEITPKQSLTAQALVTSATNPAELQALGLPATQDGSALLLDHSWAAGDWSSATSYSRYDDDFRADLGTINQVGVESFYNSTSWQHSIGGVSRLSEVLASASVSAQRDLGGRLLERQLSGFGSLTWRNETTASLSFYEGRQTFEGEDFDLGGVGLDASTRFSKGLVAGAGLSRDDGIDFANLVPGQGTTVTVYFTYDLDPWLTSSFFVDETRFEVDGRERYRTRTARLKLDIHPSLVHHVNLILNGGEGRERFGLGSDDLFVDRVALYQLVYVFQPRPLSAFYVGVSGRGIGGTDLDGIERDRLYLFAKWQLEF